MRCGKGYRINDWKFENFVFADLGAAETFCRAVGADPDDPDGGVVECVLCSSAPENDDDDLDRFARDFAAAVAGPTTFTADDVEALHEYCRRVIAFRERDAARRRFRDDDD